MLRPKEMRRVLIVGPRDLLRGTVDALHALRILHIVDFQEEDETFHMGSPLPRAREVSESLLKLRSIAGVLGLEEGTRAARGEVGPDASQRLATLELNIKEEDETRERVEELLADLNARVEALRPFADLGLDLDYYGGYESLAAFVGRMPREPEGLEEVTDAWELFRAGDAVALFVSRAEQDEVRGLLSRQGFVGLEPPAERGEPRAMLRELTDQRRRWEARRREVEERLVRLRERFADFVLSAEAFFTREVEKVEAPLRFATSDHSFLAEGWVPKERWEEMEARLEELGSLYVAALEEEEEEPPVLLDNPRPVRPFEMLTNLFSTPSYKEIDPTLTLFLVFPIFFGLMVGDLGYGIVLALVGLLGIWRVKENQDIRRFLAVILLSGVVTALFGAFLYADAFGIPFHAPHAEGHGEAPVGWDTLTGVSLPIGAAIHKLTDVVDLLVLSVVAAFIHLGLGFALGIVNEIRHDRRHAVAKGAWFLVLLGFFLLIMARVRWNRIAGFIVDRVFAFVPLAGLQLFGIQIPYVALGLLVVGAVVMAAMEFLAVGNPVAILEVASLLANMISYTRLAGIAVAKAAIAESLNNAIFHGLIFQGSLLFVGFGLFLLFGAQMIVLLLGGLSSGIQALRLNYVEFFMKFFKGNGVPFTPFGAPTTQGA